MACFAKTSQKFNALVSQSGVGVLNGLCRNFTVSLSIKSPGDRAFLALLQEMKHRKTRSARQNQSLICREIGELRWKRSRQSHARRPGFYIFVLCKEGLPTILSAHPLGSRAEVFSRELFRHFCLLLDGFSGAKPPLPQWHGGSAT